MKMISRKVRMIVMLVVTVVGVAGIACGMTASPATTPVNTVGPSETATLPGATLVPTAVTQVPVGTVTRNPTAVFEEFKAGYPPGSLIDPTRAAGATQIVQRYNHMLTETALTPTTTPYPTETTGPTATPGVGLIADTDCIPPLHSSMPMFPSCWEARVNNQWVLVGGGQFGGNIEVHRQSAILVCPGPCYRPDEGTIYLTPRNVQEVRIANVTGTLVTVVPRDPTINDSFVFDLATAQWVAPPGASPYPVYATPPQQTPTAVPPP